MGQVDLPQVEPKGQKTTDEWLYHVANVLAQIQEEMQNIMEGRISAENIRANSIETKNLKAGAVTADKITVTQLSAIAADLGHITAGLIEAVNIISSTITGSLIRTSASSYPRAEMRSTDNLFLAATDVNKSVEVSASFLGYPILRVKNAPGEGTVSYQPNPITSIPTLLITSDSEVYFSADGHIYLLTSLFSVFFTSWNQVVNNGSSRTLQQDLNAKANAFTGFTGTFMAGTQTVTVSNGIITSVV